MQQRFDSPEIAIEFCLRLIGLLRNDGMRVGTMQALACTEAINLLRSVDHGEVLRVLRLSVVNRREDLERLQRFFTWLLNLYLNPGADSPASEQADENNHAPGMEVQIGLGERDGDRAAAEAKNTAGYSDQDAARHQDFRLIPTQDYPQVMRSLERIARRHASIARRKARKSRRGRQIDVRASARTMAHYGGELVEWRYRNRIATHTPLVVIADVSGSMELYSIFLMNFLHALHRNRFLKTEVFVFSTNLQRVTPWFRRRRFADMLDDLSTHVDGWSGGTRIGQAIAELNQTHRTFISSRTVVAILSDGWDIGEADVLEREMAQLSATARSIIWVNPLKGDPDYQPLALGMAAARPYCDEFISGHSIDSLDTFATLLTTQI